MKLKLNVNSPPPSSSLFLRFLHALARCLLRHVNTGRQNVSRGRCQHVGARCPAALLQAQQLYQSCAPAEHVYVTADSDSGRLRRTYKIHITYNGKGKSTSCESRERLLRQGEMPRSPDGVLGIVSLVTRLSKAGLRGICT